MLGLEGYDYNVGYYPENDTSDWLISEEIPESTPLEDVSPARLEENADWFVEEVAKIAALNDALLIGNSTNLLTEEGGVPRVISIDHEFMLLRQNREVGLADARKGQGDIFSLRNLWFSTSSERRIELMRLFRETYLEFSWQIRTQRRELEEAIAEFGSYETGKMFEWYGAGGDNEERATTLCLTILHWENKEFYAKRFDELWQQERARVEEIISMHASLDRLPGTQGAIAILTNPDYDTARKIKEISIDSEVLQAAIAIMDDVIDIDTTPAPGAPEETYELAVAA